MFGKVLVVDMCLPLVCSGATLFQYLLKGCAEIEKSRAPYVRINLRHDEQFSSPDVRLWAVGRHGDVSGLTVAYCVNMRGREVIAVEHGPDSRPMYAPARFDMLAQHLPG